jgi:cytochrome c oxidase subunit 2
VNAKVKVYLRTQDVLHSFTLPNLRLKQDTLPGKTIPMWFQATKYNTEFDPKTGRLSEPTNKKDAWEISCQELCGGRHYAMRGRLYVHKDEKSYKAWLDYTHKKQESHSLESSVALGN